MCFKKKMVRKYRFLTESERVEVFEILKNSGCPILWQGLSKGLGRKAIGLE